jgi:hypothetical protein
MLHLALLLLSVLPQDITLRDQCDLIELNNFFDENGHEVFRQVIFLDWNAAASRFDVRAWRLVKHESQIPRPDCCGRSHYTTLWDDNGRERVVVAPSFRETWTQVGIEGDPELNARELLPKEQRRELRPALPDRRRWAR